jgi:hypothetical protein
MFNVAIDSKLRGCDVVSLKVEDIAPHGTSLDRATVKQRKTGQPVRFELTEQSREARDDDATAFCLHHVIPQGLSDRVEGQYSASDQRGAATEKGVEHNVAAG